MRWRYALWILPLGMVGCARTPSPPPAPLLPSPVIPNADARSIVFLGDSLTAGYGVDPDQSYPSLIAQRLQTEPEPFRSRFQVVNGGVNGDTTAGAMRRIQGLLKGQTALVVIALGANDGLRGVSVEETRRNVDMMVSMLLARRIPVVLASLRLPTNYGSAYRSAFERIYIDVARKHRLSAPPFLLEGVAGHPALNQADGLHPNAQGHRIIADRMWGMVRPRL